MAGSLTITTVTGGVVTFVLTAAQDNAIDRARILKNQFDGTAYPDVPTFLRDGVLAQGIQDLKQFVVRSNPGIIFNPGQAATVATNAQCAAVGLANGSTYGQIATAINGGLGLPAGSQPF